MTHDVAEIAGKLEQLVEQRNEPVRLMRSSHPHALEVAVAASNRIDRSIAEFVEANLPLILSAVRQHLQSEV